MNNKLKVIIFAIVIIILAWLGIVLLAKPTSAAEACENTTAQWNVEVKDSGVFFKCMPANGCTNNHTMLQPSKSPCPKSTDRCCRLSDCDQIASPNPRFPYKCVPDSDPNKSTMDCDKAYRCPGGAENTCCHGKPVVAPQVVTSTSTPKPSITISDCCGPIVPSNTDSIDGLIQVVINVYNCIICVVGALALLFIVLGGVVLILSGGSSERVSLGRKIIIGAVVGLIVVLASVLIVNFAIKALGGTMTV